MSIEKLRLDFTDFKHQGCNKCEQARILLALLDEHYQASCGGEECNLYDKSQALIESYREKEGTQ